MKGRLGLATVLPIETTGITTVVMLKEENQDKLHIYARFYFIFLLVIISYRSTLSTLLADKTVS